MMRSPTFLMHILEGVTRRLNLVILPAGFPLAALVALALLLPGLRVPASGHADAAVSFTRGILSGAGVTFDRPTALTFGPDGRLYVAEQEGRIRALTLDPVSKEITAVEQVTSSDDLQEVFGIAFSPTDTSSPPPVYVTNTVSGWGDDGPSLAGSFPGKVTKIHGTGYANRTDIITGLPASNYAHQTNGLVFGNDGTLYIAQGGTTSAGVPGGPFVRAEVPLSSAVLVANPSAPGFEGNITYDPPDTYDTSVDQISGDVSVYASGLRNPYDLIIHSNGRIYLTDNGPNFGGGAASTACDSQTTDPQGPDELNIIEEGSYYGHPNRNRGRFDSRECVYHSGTEGNGPDWTGPIELLPISSNGLVEYTADSFGGKLTGNLFYVGFVDGVVGRIVLSPDGSSVISHTELDSGFDDPLDITMGPDGTLYVAAYGGGNIVTLQPSAPTPTETPTPTGPTATPTLTPTKQPEGDTDGDGCTDTQENGLDETLGGRRDYLNFWDFFDPNRDRSVGLLDFLAVLRHFGTVGDPATLDPDGPEPPAGEYWASADRGGQAPDGDLWDELPANGSIGLADFLSVLRQFGHTCTASTVSSLEVLHIDVEQGDATLIISPGRETAMVDDGRWTNCANTVSYLEGLGITSIGYHFASHYHADHIGCLDAMASAGITVETACYDQGGLPKNRSATYDAYVATCGSLRQTLTMGQVITLD